MAKNVENTEAVENIAKETKAELGETTESKSKKKSEKKTEKIELFQDNKDYKDDVFVCVNGKSLMIQRGKEVEIPIAHAKVLKQSLAQDKKTAALMDAEQDKFRAEAAKRE